MVSTLDGLLMGGLAEALRASHASQCSAVEWESRDPGVRRPCVRYYTRSVKGKNVRGHEPGHRHDGSPPTGRVGWLTPRSLVRAHCQGPRCPSASVCNSSTHPNYVWSCLAGHERHLFAWRTTNGARTQSMAERRHRFEAKLHGVVQPLCCFRHITHMTTPW